MSIVLNNEEHNLVKIKIIKAINESFKNRTSSEPELISRLTYELPKVLNSICLGNIKFESGGIFIHQKPYVKNISNPNKWHRKYVELGDLLLVNNIVINNKIKQRLALLLQAKKSPINSTANIEPDNADQWDLYATWPEFEYVKNSKLRNQKRYINCIKELDIFDGVKYLLINECRRFYRYPFYLSDYVANATKPLSKFKPFYCEIFDFITGNSGKIFNLDNVKNNGNKGWDKIIDDLISEVSSASLSKGIARDFPNKEKLTRGQGILSLHGNFSNPASLFNRLNILNNGDNFPPFHDDLEDFFWEDSGISIIEINTLISQDE